VVDLGGINVSTKSPLKKMCVPHLIDTLPLEQIQRWWVRVFLSADKCIFSFRNPESTSINCRDLIFCSQLQKWKSALKISRSMTALLSWLYVMVRRTLRKLATLYYVRKSK